MSAWSYLRPFGHMLAKEEMKNKTKTLRLQNWAVEKGLRRTNTKFETRVSKKWLFNFSRAGETPSRFCIASLLIRHKMNFEPFDGANEDAIWRLSRFEFKFGWWKTRLLSSFVLCVFFMIAIWDMEACLMLLRLEVLLQPIEAFYGEKIKTSWKRVSVKSSSNVSALSADALNWRWRFGRFKREKSSTEAAKPVG